MNLKEITQEVQNCYAVFRLEHYMPQTVINMNLRRIDALGICGFRKGFTNQNQLITLKFSKLYWGLMTLDEQLDTVRHESAHAIDILVRGTTDHDAAWQFIAETLGANTGPSIKMSRAVIDLQRTLYLKRPGWAAVKCDCPTPFALPPALTRKMKRGEQFVCRKCKSVISWVTPSDKE